MNKEEIAKRLAELEKELDNCEDSQRILDIQAEVIAIINNLTVAEMMEIDAIINR